MVDEATPQDAAVASPVAPEPASGMNDTPAPAEAPTEAHDAHVGYHTAVWSGITQYVEDATGYTTFDEGEMRRRLNLPPR